ncbi:MAG: hypothetical protein ACAI35_10245 [Candidatus Methylacidiphilales bacterium]
MIQRFCRFVFILALLAFVGNAFAAESNISTIREKDGLILVLQKGKLEFRGKAYLSTPASNLNSLIQAMDIAEKWAQIAIAQKMERLEKNIPVKGSFIFIYENLHAEFYSSEQSSGCDISNFGLMRELLKQVPDMEKEIAAKEELFDSVVRQTTSTGKAPTDPDTALQKSVDELRYPVTRRVGSWSITLPPPGKESVTLVYYRQSLNSRRHPVVPSSTAAAPPPEMPVAANFLLYLKASDKARFEAVINKATEWEVLAKRMDAKSFTKNLPGLELNGPVGFCWTQLPKPQANPASPIAAPASTDAAPVESDAARSNGVVSITFDDFRSSVSLSELRNCLPLFDLIPAMEKENAERIEQAKRQDEQFK